MQALHGDGGGGARAGLREAEPTGDKRPVAAEREGCEAGSESPAESAPRESDRVFELEARVKVLEWQVALDDARMRNLADWLGKVGEWIQEIRRADR